MREPLVDIKVRKFIAAKLRIANLTSQADQEERIYFGQWRVLQRCHIDDEAVADVAFQHALVGLIDVFDVDDFDI